MGPLSPGYEPLCEARTERGHTPMLPDHRICENPLVARAMSWRQSPERPHHIGHGASTRGEGSCQHQEHETSVRRLGENRSDFGGQRQVFSWYKHPWPSLGREVGGVCSTSLLTLQGRPKSASVELRVMTYELPLFQHHSPGQLLVLFSVMLSHSNLTVPCTGFAGLQAMGTPNLR